MRIWVTIVILGILAGLEAQKGPEFLSVDRIISRIPDSLTHTTRGIADFINSKFLTQKDKSLACFIWIAKNIGYDIDKMFSRSLYHNSSEIIDKVLKSRKGVCADFAELFSAIVNETGIKAYVIQGYTKQRGFVDTLPHSWCAGMIDSTWFLFDPTWGSGYIRNGRFIKEMNRFYFMTKPKELIRTHMPFDPLWQFLNYPITNKDFYDDNFRVNKSKPFFNYSDTLIKYYHESELEQLVSSTYRVEQNGVINSLISEKVQQNKKRIESIKTRNNLLNSISQP